ncbi:MAG: xanthoxin dehydrogenase [Candidatus Azotimanducaceae bacterium]|jgi:xanthoxin dehydrogenase
MAGRLENKVVAITGAASGFGEAAAIRFVAEGAKVVLGDIQEEAGQKVAASLGDAAVFVKCNVTSEDDVANLVDTAVAHFGRLDVMYNNAGIVGAAGPIADTVTDEWKFTIDILLNGVYYGCKHAARVMIPQGSGSIVSMSSTAGLMGGLGPHAYATAKHAVIGLTKNVACELAQYGIRANAISPAGMATPMVAALQGDPADIEGTKKSLAAASPLKGRAGVADDVVNAALWLASDESGYTTGHTLTTDAGITIGSNNATPFPKHQPIIREAGKRGLDN